MSQTDATKSKMADAAAARREARRRKILENSHNRLQIISGKSSDECLKDLPIRTSIPEPVYDFPVSTSSQTSTAQFNGIPFSPPAELFQFLSTGHDIDASGDGEVANDLAPLLPPTNLTPSQTGLTEVPTLTVWEQIITYKYDIVLLSLTIQILYSLSYLTFDNSYFFLPVLVYIVTKVIWFPIQGNSNIANALMLLHGVSPERIETILHLSQCFGSVTRDIFVFMFTTICVQSLWITLRDTLIS